MWNNSDSSDTPVVERIYSFAGEMLSSMGLDLVEVQFRREQHGWVLRVFIDAEDGVTLDHCSQVSRELGDFLDVEDVIDHPYNLEVSSPGLERKLRNEDDVRRFCGRKAKIKVHQPLDGQKTFVGILLEVSENSVVLDVEGSGRVNLDFDMISTARLAI